MHWTFVVVAVMAQLVAVETLVCLTITDACNCVLAWTSLVVFIRLVGAATDAALYGVFAERACFQASHVSEGMAP